MKRISNNLHFVFYFIVLTMMTGCGTIVGELREASITTKDSLNIQEPLKVDRNKIRAVKKIAVPNLYTLAKKGGKEIPADDLRLGTAMVNALISEIKKSERFEIVSPMKFEKKVEELDLFTEVLSTDEKEESDGWAKVGRALKCDAVLALWQKAEKVNMGKAFLQYGAVGTVDVPTITILELIGSQKGDVMWYQEQASTYTSGGMGIKNTPEDQLKNMVAPIIKPLSADLLKY